MVTITIDADGQIALGHEIMRHLGVHAGARVHIRKLSIGAIAIERAPTAGVISDLFGMLKRCGQRPVAIEDMNEAIAATWDLGR